MTNRLIIKHYMALADIKKNNYVFALLFHLIKMLNQNYIYVILILYLCKIIKTIILYILMMLHQIRQENLF